MIAGTDSGHPGKRRSDEGRGLGSIELDRLVHEKARLMILTYLASAGEPETAFTELRDALAMTAGNLSIQLRNLEEAGYVAIGKSFRDRKPYTGVRLTVRGRDALDRYLAELEVIMASVRRTPAPAAPKGEA